MVKLCPETHLSRTVGKYEKTEYTRSEEHITIGEGYLGNYNRQFKSWRRSRDFIAANSKLFMGRNKAKSIHFFQVALVTCKICVRLQVENDHQLYSKE